LSKYVCSDCGFSTITRTGRCPSCGQWGTLVETDEPAKSASKGHRAARKIDAVSSLSVSPPRRLPSGIGEFDRVLGGGFVPGGVVLIGGQPGIGKSTLLLQAAGGIASSGTTVLYVSGEESSEQIALRAARLGAASERLLLYCGSDIDEAVESLSGREMHAGLTIVDSVQAMRTSEEQARPGSPNQVRAVAQKVSDAARAAGIPAVLVGHITKDGQLAGPMLLEHMVDAVLLFSGEGYSSYRMLRAMKNRYGGTDELGVFEMRDNGLAAVEDKSGLYWNRADAAVPGVAMTVAMEGSTPLMAEVQTLAAPTAFPYPRRTSRGIELTRFQLLAAVLERRAGIACGAYDLYLNIAGGLSIQDPSADLAACVSLGSAIKDKPLRGDCCYIGEVGLAGEVRPVTRLASRLKEAERLGMKRAFVSRGEREAPAFKQLELARVASLSEALRAGGV
jgi:DNA repair protein RadA/Sms